MAFGSTRVLGLACAASLLLALAPHAALATSGLSPDAQFVLGIGGSASFIKTTQGSVQSTYASGTAFDITLGNFDAVENIQEFTLEGFMIPQGFSPNTHYTFHPTGEQALASLDPGVNGTSTIDLAGYFDVDTGQWWTESFVVRVIQQQFPSPDVQAVADFALFLTSEEEGLDTALSMSPETHFALPTACGSNMVTRPDGSGTGAGPIAGPTALTLVAQGCVLTSTGFSTGVGFIDPGLVGDVFTEGVDYWANAPSGTNDSIVRLILPGSIIPEPTTALLMGSGLAGLGWIGRRKRA